MLFVTLEGEHILTSILHEAKGDIFMENKKIRGKKLKTLSLKFEKKGSFLCCVQWIILLKDSLSEKKSV